MAKEATVHSPTKPKLQSLQVVRAIGAIVIFISHAFPEHGRWGGFGVSLFIVLSGFVMYYAYQDRELEATIPKAALFSVNKIRKLYVLHLVVMIWLLFNKTNLTVNTIGLNLFLLKSWIPMESTYFSMGGVSWYLCDILILYAAFPFILKRLKKLKSVRRAIGHSVAVFFLMLAIGAISGEVKVSETVSNNFSKWVTYILPLYRLLDFIIGCELGYIFCACQFKSARNDKKHRMLLNSLAEIGAIALLYLFMRMRDRKVLFFAERWYRSTLYWLPFSCAIVLLFARSQGALSLGMTKLKPLLLIGDLSPYTFLLHVQVIHFCRDNIKIAGTAAETTMIVVCTAFILTQLLGCLFRHILERKTA